MKRLACALMLCLAAGGARACDVVIGSAAVAVVQPVAVSCEGALLLATPTATTFSARIVAAPLFVQSAPVVVERHVVVRRNRLFLQRRVLRRGR